MKKSVFIFVCFFTAAMQAADKNSATTSTAKHAKNMPYDSHVCTSLISSEHKKQRLKRMGLAKFIVLTMAGTLRSAL